jgi:hypothetical protein
MIQMLQHNFFIDNLVTKKLMLHIWNTSLQAITVMQASLYTLKRNQYIILIIVLPLNLHGIFNTKMPSKNQNIHLS